MLGGRRLPHGKAGVYVWFVCLVHMFGMGLWSVVCGVCVWVCVECVFGACVFGGLGCVFGACVLEGVGEVWGAGC